MASVVEAVVAAVVVAAVVVVAPVVVAGVAEADAVPTIKLIDKVITVSRYKDTNLFRLLWLLFLKLLKLL